MKRLVLFIALPLIVTSCMKYNNDDPSFHLSSARQRIFGEWQLQTTSGLYYVNFQKDNKALIYKDNVNYETIWELSYDKTRLYIVQKDMGGNYIVNSEFYPITRLDKNEMWLAEPGQFNTVYTFVRNQ